MEDTKDVSNAPEASGQQENLDTVKYSSYQKVLHQKKKGDEQLAQERQANAKLEAKIAEMELKAQNAEAEKLEATGKTTELLEITRQQLEAERQAKKEVLAEIDQVKRSEEETWKLQAFYSKLPGKIERTEYLAHANIDSIVYDRESRSCDEASVELVVNEFMKQHGRLVKPVDAPKTPIKSELITKFNNEKQNKSNREQLNDAVQGLFGQN